MSSTERINAACQVLEGMKKIGVDPYWAVRMLDQHGMLSTPLQRNAVEACKEWCREWRREVRAPLTSDHPLYAVFRVGTAALDLEASNSLAPEDRVVTEWARVRETNKIPGPLTDALDALLESYRRRSS